MAILYARLVLSRGNPHELHSIKVYGSDERNYGGTITIRF